MNKVKVIYGSSGGNTEDAAVMIAQKLDGEAVRINEADAADFDADLVILGTSTWGIGELQDDWTACLSLLNRVDWQGKKTALFGLGDQACFGDTFIDGVRDIYDLVKGKGAVPLGAWSTDGYRHHHSRAEIAGQFVGLALDADNQPDLTAGRIDDWCRQLKQEMNR